MKKTIALISVFTLLFILGACGKQTTDEIPTYIIEQETEETYTEFVEYPDISEVSPKSIECEMPLDIPLTFDIDKVKEYAHIRADKSYIPDTDAEAVYRNNYDEYFVYTDEIAFVIFTDSSSDTKRSYCYSAYYGEEAKLAFFGDDMYCWYFDSNGEVKAITYTYIFEETELGTTFYDKDGNRTGYMSNGIFYDKYLNTMDAEQTQEFRAELGEIMDYIEG